MNNQAIKVCHLAVVHNINDMRIFDKECRGLANYGFDLTLIAFGDKDEVLVKDKVRIMSLYCPVKNRIELIKKRNKLIYKKAIDCDADIYHLHEPELLSVGLKLKRKDKIVVFDSHEFYGWQLKDNIHKPKIIRVPRFAMKVFGTLYMKYEAYICRRLDAVVQVCTLNGKDYFEGRCRMSIFVKNMPNITDYTFNGEAATRDFSSMAMIGGLTEARGISQLVKAAAKTKTKLILAGKFIPQSYESELKQMPEYQSVDYRGFLDKKGMIDVLNQSSIGISTILNVGQYDKIDTFPTKVYDYMAMELPVIISDTYYARMMNDKYHFGICVDPENVEEIANAITYLLNNKEIAIEMGKNGRKAIIEQFNWQEEEKKLIGLYEDLIRHHREDILS